MDERWPIDYPDWTDFAPDGSLLLRWVKPADTNYWCVDCETPFHLGQRYATVDGSMSCEECAVMYAVEPR